MKHLAVLTVCCAVLQHVSAQDYLKDWNAPAEMELSGSVRSLDAATWEAVRDSAGNLVKQPGGEHLEIEDEHYTWDAEGKTLTAEYRVGRERQKEVYVYTNGRLTAIENYESPKWFIYDSTRRDRLRTLYPDSMTYKRQLVYRYNRRGQVVESCFRDTEGQEMLANRYYYRKGRLHRSVTVQSHTITNYRYDESGNLVTLESADKKRTTISSDQNVYEKGTLVKSTHDYESMGTVIERFVFTYDDKGRQLSYEHFTIRGGDTLRQNQSWQNQLPDAHGQPAQAICTINNATRYIYFTYNYDTHGNWILRTEADGDDLRITERTITYY